MVSLSRPCDLRAATIRPQSVSLALEWPAPRWIAVVRRGRPGDDLLERYGELVGAEGPPLADFLAKLDDLVPGPHAHRSHQGLDNLVVASALGF